MQTFKHYVKLLLPEITQSVTAESKRIEQRIDELLTEMELKVDRINGEGNIKQ